MYENVKAWNLAFTCLNICCNIRLTKEDIWLCCMKLLNRVVLIIQRGISWEPGGCYTGLFCHFCLFVSNRAFIWYEELKFCLQNRESPSRWKSYQVVHLYKQKEERVLCEKKLVNKPEIHQSMETNIKKCLQ